ncbi:MAG: nucleoside phosphorylase [Saprospiraceae bacterium]|nr:nucleoside phosphorylase [Saprospiraceae bacterium]MDW8229178.1 nucleoside phosphorylase [Saprospiraceae bacterium]
MPFAPSELILNADGSVYHLHLRPEQVAPIIITVGDPDRVAKVSQCFDAVECRVQKREFITHTGRVGRLRLSVLSSGIGPDNIDIVVNELDAVFNIDLQTREVKNELTTLTIIRLGTAGGLQPEVPVDGFVASVGGLGLDGLLLSYQAASLWGHPVARALRQHFETAGGLLALPYYAPSDAVLLERFTEGFHRGFTATHGGFYGPQGRQLRALRRLPDYLDCLQRFEYEGVRVFNLEMETAALFGLCRLLGHRAASVSAIIANRALGRFSSDPEAAVQRLIEATLERLLALAP